MAREAGMRRGIVRWWIRSVVLLCLFGVALFAAAGDLGWRMAWVYLGLYATQQFILAWILPPDLLAERASVQGGTKSWDRVLVRLGALLLPLGIYVVSGLDHRYAWTASLSPGVWLAALAVMVLGMVLTGWAMAANRFFSGTVRIQLERAHVVVTNGPYRIVRHPGYVGGIAHHLASPLVLGSWWALVPGVLGALVLVVRTALEDRTLHDELAGYAEYGHRTRYRLLPGVW